MSRVNCMQKDTDINQNLHYVINSSEIGSKNAKFGEQ